MFELNSNMKKASFWSKLKEGWFSRSGLVVETKCLIPPKSNPIENHAELYVRECLLGGSVKGSKKLSPDGSSNW